MPRALFLSVTSRPELPPLRLIQERDALAERGWEVDTVEILRLAAPPIGRFLLRAHMFRKLTRDIVQSAMSFGRPDIIIAHDIETLPAGVRVSRATGVPLVYDSHEWWPALISNNSKLEALAAELVERRALRRVSHVLTVSESIAGRFRRLGKPATVLYNARRRGDIRVMDRETSRRNLGYNPCDFVVGFVGNLHELDRGDMFGILQDAIWDLDDVRVLVVGGPDDTAGSFRGRAGRRIRVVGHVPYGELEPYYAALDLGLVLLDRRPNFVNAVGWKFFDYMARGVPILAPDFPDIGGIIRDTGCGWVYDDFRVTLGQVAYADPSLLRAVGTRGRLAFERYCWDAQAPAFVRVMEGLTDVRLG